MQSISLPSFSVVLLVLAWRFIARFCEHTTPDVESAPILDETFLDLLFRGTYLLGVITSCRRTTDELDGQN